MLVEPADETKDLRRPDKIIIRRDQQVVRPTGLEQRDKRARVPRFEGWWTTSTSGNAANASAVPSVEPSFTTRTGTAPPIDRMSSQSASRRLNVGTPMVRAILLDG